MKIQRCLHRSLWMTIFNKIIDARITDLLFEGVKNKVFPGAVVLIAVQGKIIFFKAAGVLSIDPPQKDTKKDSIFDLASLTKPLATTIAIMGLVDRGVICLDDQLNKIISGPLPGDKQTITPRLLLCHSSGLPDWKPYYLELIKHPVEKRKDILRQCILNECLEYPPGLGSQYSDLGFMLLEWIVEESSGSRMDNLLRENFYNPLGLKRTFLMKNKSPCNLSEIAATEDCPWRKKVLCGEVHDENAYALGGYSGHAGLFGCAEDIFLILNMLREHFYSKKEDFFKAETVKRFFTRQNIFKGSSWALGWDTPSSEGSSSGSYFSSKSVGHLGFTGSSVWMDPEQDIIVIFLTNRVHKTRENRKIKFFRPVLHDLILESIINNQGLS